MSRFLWFTVYTHTTVYAEATELHDMADTHFIH